jgi:hypothetical protein
MVEEVFDFRDHLRPGPAEIGGGQRQRDLDGSSACNFLSAFWRSRAG